MPTATLLDITDEATRRQFLSLLVAAGLLTACADDDDADPQATPSAPTTRTVESSHGPIQIPIAPTRVVAMHDQLVAYAIASLGFDKFVGIAARDANDPTQAIRQFGAVPAGFANLENIGTYEIPDLEAIAAAKPDLIIGLPYEADPIYDKLSAIAPTVIIDLVAGARPPFQRQRDLARVVGVEPALDARLAEYRAKLAALKEGAAAGLAGAGYVYLESFGTGAEDNYVVKSVYSPGLVVLADLGLVPSTTIRPITDEYFTISQENLGDYDADIVFVGLPEEGEFDPLNLKLMAETFAAQNNQIITVSRDIWSVEVVEALFGVIDGLEKDLAGREFKLSGEYGTPVPSPEAEATEQPSDEPTEETAE